MSVFSCSCGDWLLCYSAAANSPVEVVGNVDVALRSGQQEHDKGVL